MSLNKRIITDETGRDIAASLSILAGEKVPTYLTSWDAIGITAGQGNASRVFNIGDLISEPWIDTADGNKSYDNPWRVNHFSKETDINGNTIDGMWLQTKYTHPFGVQFSHERAFLACPDGLAAGTYHFDFAEAWGDNIKTGISYQFTLTKAVEKGGRLAGCYGAPSTSPSSWKVYSYGANGITLNETVSVSTGSAGTNLGTMKAIVRQGNLNCFQEMAYGNNRWSTSALRQYLNSDATKGNWWKPQDQWDIAPNQLSTNDGFLCGMNAEMLRNIVPIKTITRTNGNTDGDVEDATYDKIIIPSLEQMYIQPQVSNEGESHEYWKELNGTSTKWRQWNTYDILKQYSVSNHTAPQYTRFRGAGRGGACGAWYVDSSGYVNCHIYYSGASYAYTFEPACFIHR